MYAPIISNQCRASDIAPQSSLNRVSNSSESSSIILRVIEFFSLSKENGDCVVVLLAHPGPNLLGRYFPPSKVNKLLLGDSLPRARPSPFRDGLYAMGLEDSYALDGEEMEPFDIMDLASFLEYVTIYSHTEDCTHRNG